MKANQVIEIGLGYGVSGPNFRSLGGLKLARLIKSGKLGNSLGCT